jgi:hypothetical protein
MEIVKGILVGACLGAVTALTGYAKSVGEKFDYQKAFQTVVVGAVVGGFSSYSGMTYQQSFDYLTNIGAITLVEYLKKAVWRRIKREQEV